MIRKVTMMLLVSLLAEALFLVFADGRKETSAMDRNWLWFNRRPRSWTAVLQRVLLALLADRNLSPLRLAHFFTLILLSFIEPTLLDITRSFTREISIVKRYKVCFSFGLDYLDDGKIKKMEWGAVKGPVSFFNPARHVCVLGDRGCENSDLPHCSACCTKGEISAI